MQPSMPMIKRMAGALSGALGLVVLALSAGSAFAGDVTTGTGTQTATAPNSATSQSQAAAGAASIAGSNASNAGNAQIINFPSTPAEQTIKNVPQVYAPGLAAAGSEVCLGSLSAGGSGAGFGLTIGGTFVDRECQLRLNARTLAVLGYPVAARETLCLDADVRQAMLAAGTPCAADRYAPGYAPGYAAAAPAPTRAAVAQPPRTYAVAPAQTGPAQNEPAAESDPTSGLEPGCHREYQVIGGWYVQCPVAAAARPPAQTLAENAAETPPQTPPAKAHAQTLAKNARAKTPAQTAHTQTPAQNAQGQTSAQNVRTQTLAKNARAQTPAQNAQAQTPPQNAQGQTAAQNPHTQTLALNARAQTPTQNADTQTRNAPVPGTKPASDEPEKTAASDPISDAKPGCHREYQVLGGWYERCE